MEMLRGEAKAIKGRVETEDHKGPCMEIGIDYNYVKADVHVEDKFEQESPEDNSDR